MTLNEQQTAIHLHCGRLTQGVGPEEATVTVHSSPPLKQNGGYQRVNLPHKLRTRLPLPGPDLAKRDARMA
jgi:hypothetical protein